MTSISIGTVAGEVTPVSIDLARLLESRLLLQANSGGGKSWALRRLLEESHGHVQHLVLDVEGEFHTLREKFDYVLAARSGGDTLADVRAAPVLARRILELGVSAIFDLYELQQNDRIRFVKAFLEALMSAPKNLWHKALIVVDEAHVFCPQDNSAESTAAVIDLMTRGRKRGFCGVLATPRLSQLNKNAAGQANVKLIGRASLDVDVDRASREIGFTKAQGMERLRRLRDGRFYAFGPGLSDEVVEIQVGPVQTTHPRAGQASAPIPPPREKVRKVLAQLADLPREAEEEARTAAELRTENARLKRDLAAKPQPPAPATPVIERVEVPVLPGETAERLEGALARWEAATGQLAAVGKEVADALRNARSRDAPVPQRKFVLPETAARSPARSPGPTSVPVNGDLSGPEQRIVDAIAWLESIGNARPRQEAVAFLAGYTASGGSYQNTRGKLRSAERIEYDGRSLWLLPAGRALARFPAEALTAQELQARVLEKLPGPCRKILAPLLVARELSNDELARRAGYEPSGGSYQNSRGRLSSLGLIEYRNGVARAKPFLFLE